MRHPSLSAALFACGLLSVSLLRGPEARAETSPATLGEEHAARARVAYDLQEWEKAAQEFAAAYHAEPRAQYLWGRAQAQRLGGDCASAIKTFKAYERADVTPTRDAAAEAQIAKCEAEIEKAGPVEESAEPATTRPEPEPSLVAPVVAEPPLFEPPPAAPAATGALHADPLGSVLLVAGVAGVSAGTYFLVRGNLDMRVAALPSTYQSDEAGLQRASTERTVCGLALAAGGVLVGGAIVRYLTSGDAARPGRSAWVAGPTGVAGWF